MPGSYLALLSPERRTPPSQLTVPLGNCISVGGVGREDPQQDRSVVGRQPAGIGFFGELVAHPNKRGAQLPPTQRALSGESTSPSIPDTAPRVSFRRRHIPVPRPSHTPSIRLSRLPGRQHPAAHAPSLGMSSDSSPPWYPRPTPSLVVGTTPTRDLDSSSFPLGPQRCRPPGLPTWTAPG